MSNIPVPVPSRAVDALQNKLIVALMRSLQHRSTHWKFYGEGNIDCNKFSHPSRQNC